jgi:hypothetical protein
MGALSVVATVMPGRATLPQHVSATRSQFFGRCARTIFDAYAWFFNCQRGRDRLFCWNPSHQLGDFQKRGICQYFLHTIDSSRKPSIDLEPHSDASHGCVMTRWHHNGMPGSLKDLRPKSWLRNLCPVTSLTCSGKTSNSGCLLGRRSTSISSSHTSPPHENRFPLLGKRLQRLDPILCLEHYFIRLVLCLFTSLPLIYCLHSLR